MITFKTYLAEKAMNKKAFDKTLKRQGSKAKVGFEFEMFVPLGTTLLKTEENRDWLRVDAISDISELVEYFIISKDVRRRLERDFDEWTSNDDDNTWETFVSEKFGTIYKMIKSLEIEPKFGWEADTGQSSSRFFVDDPVEDNSDIQRQMFARIETDLGDHLGMNVTVPWRGAKAHFERGDWLIVPDGSIEGDRDGIGAEVVSPPLPLTNSLLALGKMFDWMSKNGIMTNESTGLHINISMPGIENVDLVKLVLLMGENYVLKQFDRLTNTYTKPQVQAIINNLTDSGTLPREAKGMIDVARKALSSHKYSSVHIEKLKDGYLEFRIAGDENYHQKFDLVRDTVLRFVSALEVAVDPNEAKNEYLKKLSKVLAAVETSDSNDYLKDKSISDLLIAGDQEATADNLGGFLSQAKGGRLIGPSAMERASTWFHDVFLKSLFRALLELNIKKPSARQRSEFRLIAKRLKIDPETFTGPADPWKADVLKKFEVRK